MEIGRVKWFNNEKGYGFLSTPASDVDVFVHFSDIEMDGYKSLQADMTVSFEIRHSGRGPSAQHVRPLNDVHVSLDNAAHPTMPNHQRRPAPRHAGMSHSSAA